MAVTKKSATTEAKQEYTNVGRFLGQKVDNDKLTLKGLLIVKGVGCELALFYAADKDIEYAESNGYDAPFGTGSAKIGDEVAYWVKAYLGSGSIALKLQLTNAKDKTEKLNLNLFYCKGSDTFLEGNVSAKVQF